MEDISMWSTRITSFIFGTAFGTRTMHSNEEGEGERDRRYGGSTRKGSYREGNEVDAASTSCYENNEVETLPQQKGVKSGPLKKECPS